MEKERTMTDARVDLLARAREGDSDAFHDLTAPHHRELHVHCYRMLGSLQDAEDALQDALLSAWQALDRFEGRSSVRTWLYTIATNRCLNLRRSASSRGTEWTVPGVELPEPSRLGEIAWLQPYPNDLDPAAWVEQRDSMSLAFVTALQALPPRQVAVLLLRDVLGFPASDVASMLDSTLDAVNAALSRARAGMRQHRRAASSAPAPMSAVESTLVDAFVRAYQASDIEAVVALLTDEIFISMPPLPFEYEGPAAARSMFSSVLGGRRFELVQTRANGQPAFGTYLLAPDGTRHGTGMLVLTLEGDRISALTRFEAAMLPWFGLPRVL